MAVFMHGGVPLLNWFKKSPAYKGSVGLEVSPDGVALVQLTPSRNARPILDGLTYIACKDEKHQAESIGQMVNDNQLKGALCHLVLTPSDYELLLVDAPQVPDEELAEAMRWRIKDLIDFPLEQAVVDVCPLPDDAYRGRMNMVYVVVCRQERIRYLVDLVAAAGLYLDSIDITELVLSNLATLVDQNTRGIALLRLRSSRGLINLCQNNSMYLTRNIETGLGALTQQSDEGLELDIEIPLDNLALEIQRSLDYYESQLGKGSVDNIVLLPLRNEMPELLEGFNSRLPVPVKVMDINELMQVDIEVDRNTLVFCLASMGAALREQGVVHAEA